MSLPVTADRISADRERGERTEIEFCLLIQKHGYYTFRFQEGRSGSAVLERNQEHIVLPDVFAISNSGMFFAEVKSKYPNKHGSFGLEKYRALSLLTFKSYIKSPVLYAIYDTKAEKWVWNDIAILMQKPFKEFESKTYFAGGVKSLPTLYFKKKWFLKIEKGGKLNFPLFFGHSPQLKP